MTLSTLELGELQPSADGNTYLGNYIGPHWSDGKFQESVEWGDSDPQDELDLLAYYHDSAYAKYKDEYHRTAADAAFHEAAMKLSDPRAKAAALAVLQGNMAKDSLARTWKNFFGPLGPLGGLVYTAAGTIIRANDMLPGGKYDQAKEEIEKHRLSDPKKRHDMFKIKEVKAVENLIKQHLLPTIDKQPGNTPQGESKPVVNSRPPGHRPPGQQAQQDVVVNEPRSFFSRIFRKKKKKKRTPQQILEAQAKHVQHHINLHEDAKNSSLKPSKDLKVKPFGFNDRFKRAYSAKRRAQMYEINK